MDLDINKLLETARKPIVMAAQDGEQPFAFVPEGYKRESIESVLERPIRKRASVTMNDTGSFINYVNKHSGFNPNGHESLPPDHTTLYSDADFEAQTIKIVGVLDDNGGDQKDTKWRDHTALYHPKKTVEWGRWNSSDGKRMPQKLFAEFIEENLPDIASVEGMPSGSDMLRMATQFEMNSNKRFKSSMDLQSNGVSLTFIDEQDGETEAKMSLFKKFTLGIRVFIGGNGYPLEARLKFKANQGVLEFWYELIRPDRVFATAVGDELDKIEALTGCLLLNGSPGLKA